MTEQPNVQLALPSRAENVVLVREALAGLAESVAFGNALDDVKAAVSEACNNVVVHAYPGGVGPMEVDVRILAGELEVLVRDFGVGTAHRAVDDEAPGRGIGLAVVEALAARVDLRAHPGDGVEIEMAFEIPDPGEFTDSARTLPERPQPTVIGASSVRLSIIPSALAGPILNRLVAALGARVGFSLDRLSDAQLVSDALGARIESVLDGGLVAVGVDALERAVALRVGRLRSGGAAALLAGSAVGELGPLIERLADELEVTEDDGTEVLSLLMRAAA
jgi:serine/threonine-protein kinase RsbW